MATVLDACFEEKKSWHPKHQEIPFLDIAKTQNGMLGFVQLELPVDLCLSTKVVMAMESKMILTIVCHIHKIPYNSQNSPMCELILMLKANL